MVSRIEAEEVVAKPMEALRSAPRRRIVCGFDDASWLNLVERWFALLTEKQIKRGVHHSPRALEAAILAFIAVSNTTATPFVWTKTADEILASVARFCHRISGQDTR
jgi:hypothetical protein